MKICFVVQRYGLEINGGAELLTRQLAERLSGLSDMEVSVVTTKALDYDTWENVYVSDSETINGVTVYRFPVEHPRNVKKFLRLNEMVIYGEATRKTEEDWLDTQGPYCPKLVEYIRENSENFDVFLFCTYLYYPTVMGIREVREKAILVPFAHDEPFLRMKIFQELFDSPAALIFETDEERELIRGFYENYQIPCIMGGAGVDVPSGVDADAVRKKFDLGRYIIYAGRIDVGKNCDQLVQDFIRYKEEIRENHRSSWYSKENGENNNRTSSIEEIGEKQKQINNPQEPTSDLTLVMIGKKQIDIPERDDIKYLGFVSENDKFSLIAGAEYLVLPSKYESLSIAVLEAFSLGRPVLVNGECDVLRGHCEKSGGGFYYNNYEEFRDFSDKLLADKKLNSDMGQQGREYVESRFNWDIIRDKVAWLIRSTQQNKKEAVLP